MNEVLLNILQSFLSHNPSAPLVVSESDACSILAHITSFEGTSLENLHQSPITDVFLFESEKEQFSIEETRHILESATLRPYGEWNIFIIRDAEKMGIQAANSLLKMLEETKANQLFLLTVSKKSALLETIASRILFVSQNISDEFVLWDELTTKIEHFIQWDKSAFLAHCCMQKGDKNECIAILKKIGQFLKNCPKANSEMWKKIDTSLQNINQTNVSSYLILDDCVLFLSTFL